MMQFIQLCCIKKHPLFLRLQHRLFQAVQLAKNNTPHSGRHAFWRNSYVKKIQNKASFTFPEHNADSYPCHRLFRFGD